MKLFCSIGGARCNACKLFNYQIAYERRRFVVRKIWNFGSGGSTWYDAQNISSSSSGTAWRCLAYSSMSCKDHLSVLISRFMALIVWMNLYTFLMSGTTSPACRILCRIADDLSSVVWSARNSSIILITYFWKKETLEKGLFPTSYVLYLWI